MSADVTLEIYMPYRGTEKGHVALEGSQVGMLIEHH